MKRKFMTSGAGILALVLMLAAQASAAAEINVRGRLGRTVEPGGWLILANQKYLLINASRWSRQSWFREGAEVEAAGETRDVMTTHMEGTPFEARTLRAAARAGAANGAANTDGAATANGAAANSDATNGAGGGAAAQQRGEQQRGEVTAPRTPGVTRVVVSGDSLVQERPDTAVVTVSVVTQSRTALAAQQDNARLTEAVVRAVREAAGAGAEVETSGYTLQPQYTYREGQPPLIQSYQAQNSVTVTLGDLTRVGPVIDAASGAGANQVSGLSFTLRRDQPARQRALTEATRQAMSKAQVMAQALGGRVVRVVEVIESTAEYRPVPVFKGEVMAMSRDAARVPTPVEVGSLDIRSQVTLVAEVSTDR